MKKNLLKGLLLSCSVAVVLSACVKDKYTGNQASGAGPSYVRITEAKVYNQFFSPFTTVKAVDMFSVRRDPASDAALQTTNVVTLTDISSTYINAYNTKNGTSYAQMPTTMYTVAATAGITATSTGYTFTFGPGDFAKVLTYNIDGSKVDLSKQYAVAFAITNTGGLTQKAGLDTIIATVAIKNKYDGVYKVTSGTMVDVTNSAFTHINNFLASFGTAVGLPDNGVMQYELRTTSANTCLIYDNYFFGGTDVPFSTGTTSSSYSYYGSFCPVLTFDLSTNKITAVTNSYGQPASNGRYAQLDPSGTVNAYESGKITFKYNMVGGSGVTANQVRTTWDQVFTYYKSR